MKITQFIRKKLGTATLSGRIKENNKLLNELNWAFIFNNSLEGCNWLKDQGFSPGRYAAGYPLLFILFKALELSKPQNLLECGLGQSSKMLFRYAQKYENVNVTTLEHDTTWINFFNQGIHIPDNAKIVTVENISVNIHGVDTLSINDIERIVGNKKFDLILIDAPFGSARYSRSQVLSFIPGNIDLDNFILVMDDYNRIGEKDTCFELENLFLLNNIKYFKGIYCGIKDTVIYCSPNLKFLTTV